MAKAGKSNPIEQHAEKGILVVCLLLLLYVVLTWVTSSPREFAPPREIANQALSPEQIDKEILRAANRLKLRLDNAPAPRLQVIDLTGEIRYRERHAFGGPQDPYTVWAKPFVTLGAPSPVDDIIPPPPGQELTLGQLAVSIKPSPPLVALERELPERANPTEVAAHVASTYPWQELRDKWYKVLENTRARADLVVLAVHAEVRERPIGGKWGPPRPAPRTAMPISIRIGSEQKVIQLPDDIPTMPKFDPQDVDSKLVVDQAKAALGSGFWQTAMIEPPYYRIWCSPARQWGSWRAHLPKTSVSEKALEEAGPEDITGPERPMVPEPRVPVAPPPTRVPEPRVPVAPPRTRVPEPRAPVVPPRTRVPEPRAPVAPPRTRVPDEGVRPVRPPQPPVPPKRPVPKPAEAEGVLQALPRPTPVPPLARQMQDGTVLLWFHQDTGLEPRQEYQYRVQLEFLNPGYAMTDVWKESKDAEAVSLKTPFSDWSEPVSVPQATEFFLAGMSQGKYVRVAVFTTCYGQWVMDTFNVFPGQPIGEKVRVPVPPAPTPQVGTESPGGARGGEPAAAPAPVAKKEVDFSTGAIAVELDFDKDYRPAGLSMTRKTVEMLYLDYRGQLRRKTLAADASDKEYQRLKKEAQQALAGAGPTGPPPRK